MAPPLKRCQIWLFLILCAQDAEQEQETCREYSAKVHSRGNSSWSRMKAFISLLERPIMKAWKMESPPNAPVAIRDRDKVIR